MFTNFANTVMIYQKNKKKINNLLKKIIKTYNTNVKDFPHLPKLPLGPILLFLHTNQQGFEIRLC
jgi:hypothetical protein